MGKPWDLLEVTRRGATAEVQGYEAEEVNIFLPTELVYIIPQKNDHRVTFNILFYKISDM